MSALAGAASGSCDPRWFGKDPSPATGGGHRPQPRRSPPAVPPLLQSKSPGTGLGIWLWLLPSPPPYLCPGCPPWVSDSVPRSLTGGLPYLSNRSLHSYPAGVCSDPSPVLELSPLLSGTVFIITAPETREAGSENRSASSRDPALLICFSPRLTPEAPVALPSPSHAACQAQPVDLSPPFQPWTGPWAGIYLHALPKADPSGCLPQGPGCSAARTGSLGSPLLCCRVCLKEHRLASLRIPGTGWAALGGHNHIVQSCRWQRDPQLREVPSGQRTVRSRDRDEERCQARQEDPASESFSGGSPSWMSFQTSQGLFPPLLAGWPHAGTGGLCSLGLGSAGTPEASFLCRTHHVPVSRRCKARTGWGALV